MKEQGGPLTPPSPRSPGSPVSTPAAADLFLRIYPDPQLQRRCQPLGPPDPQAKACLERMFELMYEHQGIGLAAPQVGWGVRAFVLNVCGDSQDSAAEMVFIDPHIETIPGDQEADEEGCLSLPGIRLTVDRHPGIRVKATDIDGQPFQLEADGLLARCIQHETDHLDGILITARVSTLKRIAVNSELRELKQKWEDREGGD